MCLLLPCATGSEQQSVREELSASKSRNCNTRNESDRREQIAALSPHAVNDLRPYAAYALFVIGLA